MINKATNFVLGLYHYSVLLRDTLEYTYVRKHTISTPIKLARMP
jgi:sRNA-binding regulator protein Hfq